MAIIVKGSTSGNSATATIPTATGVGDLLVFFMATYAGQPTAPAGWTQIAFSSSTTGNSDYSNSYYKIATAGDTGTLSIANMQANYCGWHIVCLSGYSSLNPINISSTLASGSTSSLSTASGNVATNKTTRRLSFFSLMSNDSTTPTFTTAQTNWTTLAATQGVSGYHGTQCNVRAADDVAGSYPPQNQTTSVVGSGNGIMVAIEQGNTSPSATNLQPNNTFKDNRIASAFTWTYSDTESNPQTALEIGYRLKGISGDFTIVAETSSTSTKTFAANTFVLGKEYEWRVRVDDGFGGGLGNWSSTASFLAGTSVWSSGSEIAQVSSTGSLPSNLSPGAYYVEVRTSDQIGFGYWSNSVNLIVTPTNNIYVRVNGVWVLGSTAKQIRQGGVWKSVPPTMSRWAGTFK